MDIRYFMDECSDWEINNIIENLSWTDRNLWDTQRLNAYLTAKSNFKGIKDLKDICHLPWDDLNKGDIEITDLQIQECKEFAKKNLGKEWQQI